MAKKKEKPEPEERKEAKGPTLKERIAETIDENYEDKEELKKSVFDLVQRVLYPDQFCPECDDRLFLSGNTYSCLNCGYLRENKPSSLIRDDSNRNVNPPINRPSEGKVPEQVEKIISEAERNSDIRRTNVSGKGKRIRELAEQLGDSSVPPTKEDENILKGADPNVKEVNWV